MWRVSRILNKSPWDEEILGLNQVQVDFILKMYAKDHPDEFKVLDGRIVDGVHPHQIWKDWSGVFSGKLGDEFDRNPILFLKKHYGVNVLKD